jgi:hypothetical protein
MKKLVEVQEVENEGLMKLLGKRVTFFCMNYIYTGDLLGVNDDCVLLGNPAIVYDTGDFKAKEYTDEQFVNMKEGYLQKSSFEFFGERNAK